EIQSQLKLSKSDMLKNTPITLDKKITQTVKNISPSVVSIIIKKDLVVYRTDPWGFFRQPLGSVERKVGGGTGFFVSKDGKIITNKHVVSDIDATYTVIASDNKEYDANVIATDPRNDIAILQISDKDMPSVPGFEPLEFIENKDEIQLGQFAIAIGNALAEFENSVSLGIVSGKNRTIADDSVGLSGLIQTDAAINPGNSGGPLLNLDGRVIGMNTLIIGDSEGVGFAITLTKSRLEYILKSIADSGRIKRAFLGINYISITPGIKNEFSLGSDNGVYILDKPGSVVTGSNAQSAGLEPGDVITTINDIEINSKNTLPNTLDNKIPGDILKLKVIKKSGDQKTISLELGEI
ncbi:trypsin-like peptidase domain-containing protein, partial [Candidatus Gracilibacteria bacterium]|nr:trypsin-like peptidase domain-containing protein [Candidatus Gracilibacteria bacterium]